MITVKATPKTTVDVSDSSGFFIDGFPPVLKTESSYSKNTPTYLRVHFSGANIVRRPAPQCRLAFMEYNADRTDA